MRSKKELIEIANALDTGMEYASLYGFASNFLQSKKQQGDTEDFFRTVEVLAADPGNRRNSVVLGFSGKNSSLSIKKWCNYIIPNGYLQELEYGELHFVMGYCARQAYIHKKSSLKSPGLF